MATGGSKDPSALLNAEDSTSNMTCWTNIKFEGKSSNGQVSTFSGTRKECPMNVTDSFSNSGVAHPMLGVTYLDVAMRGLQTIQEENPTHHPVYAFSLGAPHLGMSGGALPSRSLHKSPDRGDSPSPPPTKFGCPHSRADGQTFMVCRAAAYGKICRSCYVESGAIPREACVGPDDSAGVSCLSSDGYLPSRELPLDVRRALGPLSFSPAVSTSYHLRYGQRFGGCDSGDGAQSSGVYNVPPSRVLFPWYASRFDAALALAADPYDERGSSQVLGEWLPYFVHVGVPADVQGRLRGLSRGHRIRLSTLIARARSLGRRFPGYWASGSKVSIDRTRSWEVDDVRSFPVVVERNPDLVRKLRSRIRSKKEYVSANAAARLVFQDRPVAASARFLKQEQARAEFRVDSYDPPDKEVRNPLLSEFIFQEQFVFYFCGSLFSDIRDLERHPNWPDLWTGLQNKIRLAFKHKILGLLRECQREIADTTFFEGNAESSPGIKVTHHVVAPSGPQVTEFVEAVVAAAGPAVTTSMKATLAQLSALAFSLYAAQSAMSAVGALMQFAAGCPMVYGKIMQYLKTAEASLTRAQLQGTTDVEGGWYEKTTAEKVQMAKLVMMDYGFPLLSGIGLAIAGVLTSMFSPVLGPMVLPSLTDITKSVRVGLMKEIGSTVAKYILECVSEIAARIKSAVKEKSLLPLWGRKWDPRRYAEELEAMMTHMTTMTASAGIPGAIAKLEELRKADHIPSYWTAPVTMKEFVERGEELYDHGAELALSFKPSPVASAISRLRDRFRAFLDGLVVGGEMGDARVAPFMLFFHGPPGGGKTTFMNSVMRALGKRQRYSTPEEGIYQWQMKANFQDGLTHLQWGILMDDIDQSAAQPTAGFENHVEVVLKVVDNKPCPIEQAHLGLKGRIRANPMFVGYCTNFKDAKLHNNCNEPNAFWRRVAMHFYVVAKPEFRADNTGRLDKAKAMRAGTHDLYELWMSEFRPVKGDTTHPWSTPIKISQAEFFRRFYARFDEHLEMELVRMRRLALAPDACPSCFLPITEIRCACPTAEEIELKFTEFDTGAGGTENPSFESPVDVEFLTTTTYAAGILLPQEPPEEEVTLEGTDDSESEPRTVREKAYAYMVKALREAYVYARCSSTIIQNRVVDAWYDAKAWADGKCEEAAQVGRRYRVLIEEMVRDLLLPRVEKLLVAAGVAVAVLVAASIVLKKWYSYQLQGREHMASGVAPMSWLRAEQNYVPGLPLGDPKGTFTYDEMLRAAKESVFEIGWTGPDGVFHRDMYVTMLTSHYGVCLKHLLDDVVRNGKTTTVTINYPFHPVHIELNASTWIPVPSNPELYLICVDSGRPCVGILGKIPLCVDGSVATFDEVQFAHPTGVRAGTTNEVAFLTNARVLISNYDSENGSCGLPVFARFQQSWKIVGIHYGTHNGFFHRTTAALLVRRELDAVAQSQGIKLQGIGVIKSAFSRKEHGGCTLFPVKSEVLVAVSCHGARLHPFGELQPAIEGRKTKTKIRKSVYAAYYEELAARMTGSPDYWRVPDFRGWMGERGWTSPFTNAFGAQNPPVMDEDLMLFCIADYIRGAHKLDTDGYGTLSEEQAISGVPGSYIHSINLRTSAGPPFAAPKSLHYSTQEEVGFSPEMAKIIDETEAILAEGLAPIPHGVCTLKDECVKPNKLPRVFTNLPSGYNICVKRRFAALTCWMRANMEFFESAVGIDMTSQECEKLVQFWKAVDPELMHMFDNDAFMMDKGWSGKMWAKVTLALWCLAKILGIDADKVELLLKGMAQTLMSIKGDVFSAHWNPSGIDITIMLNGIGICLGERYTFYKQWFRNHPFPKEWVDLYRARMRTDPRVYDHECPDAFVFRLLVALMTYGDDNNKATKVPPPEDYEEIWKAELGFKMTDASKEGRQRQKSLAETTFLKRSFVYDEELQRHLCPLSKKSIARMVLFCGDTQLGDIDHAVVSANEALREMALHGQKDYDELRELVTRVMTENGQMDHPWLEIFPYSEWREQMKKGVFRTWRARSNIPLRQLTGEVDKQGEGGPPPEAPGLSHNPGGGKRVNPVFLLIFYLIILLLARPGRRDAFGIPSTFSVSYRKLSDTSLSPITTMSQVQSVKQGVDPVQNSEATEVATKIEYEIGEFVSDSGLVKNTANEVLVRHQTFPETALGDYLTRPVEIYTFTLSSSDLIGTSAASFPWRDILLNAAIQAKTSNFAYIQGRLQLIFVTAIPGNSYGTYVFSLVPNGGPAVPDATRVGSFSMAHCMQVDHWVRLDCANSENLVLEMPWVWPYDVAAISDVGEQWELYHTCLAPLATAIPSGVAAGQVRVLAAFVPGYELSVPHFEGKFTPTAHTAKYAPIAHKAMQAAMSHPGMVATHAKLKAVSGGRAEGVAGAVENIAEKLSGVPVIGPYAATAAKVASKAKALFHHFGFSRESAEIPPITVTQRSVTNVARVDGIDRGDVAALTGVGEISIDPQLVGALSDDQGSFASFISRWTVISNFGWSPTNVTGDSLVQIPVTPYFGLGTGNYYFTTAAGYYGLPFSYWRTDMEYLVILPVSKLHRGSLQIVWNNSSDASVPAASTNLAMNMIIDISAGGEHSFTVGFAQDRPFLPQQVMNQEATIFNLGTCNGMFTLQVMNPLTSQNNLAVVNGTILARAKPNAQFALPSSRYFIPGPDGAVRNTMMAWAYEGADGDDDGHEAATHTLVTESGPYPAGELLFPAETLAPRALMQKPTRVRPLVPDGAVTPWLPWYAAEHFLPPPHSLIDPPNTDSTALRGPSFQFTWASHFGICFTGVAASVKWKMVPQFASFLSASPMYTPLMTASTFFPGFPTLGPLTFCGPNQGAEFVVPYDFPKKYVRWWEEPDVASGNFQGRRDLLITQDGTGAGVPCVFFYSLGADIRLAPFRYIPIVEMIGASNTSYQATNQDDSKLFQVLQLPA